MSGIAANIMVNVITATGTLDRLAEKGALERYRASADRRIISNSLFQRNGLPGNPCCIPGSRPIVKAY